MELLAGEIERLVIGAFASPFRVRSLGQTAAQPLEAPSNTLQAADGLRGQTGRILEAELVLAIDHAPVTGLAFTD